MAIINRQPKVSIEYPTGMIPADTKWSTATMRYNDNFNAVIVVLDQMEIQLTMPEIDAITGLKCLLFLKRPELEEEL